MYTITVSTDKSKTFQEVPTFPAAWNMAKKEATDLAEMISEAQDCYVSNVFRKRKPISSYMISSKINSQYFT